MAYKINGTDVIQNNGNAVFQSVTVNGGTISLPDSNPARNTVGFKISTQTNVDSFRRGVHANVTVNATSPSNNVSVGGGKNFGFSAGGMTSLSVAISAIQRFTFSSDSPSIVFGSILFNRTHGAGVSSPTHGYNIGGVYGIPYLPFTPAPIGSAPPVSSAGMVTWTPSAILANYVKFPFSSVSARVNPSPAPLFGYLGMVGLQSETHGFAYGGIPSPTTGFPGGYTQASNVLTRFPFASDAVSTFGTPLAGNGSFYGGGVVSSTDGYICGGGVGVENSPLSPQYVNGRIHKFPFSTGVLSTTITFSAVTSTTAGMHTTGHFSATHGYYVGGKGTTFTNSNTGVYPTPPSPWSNALNIRKFAFSNDSSASLIGFLSPAQTLEDSYAHQSSDSNGYIERGVPTILGASGSTQTSQFNTAYKRTKFSFTTDGSATLIGDLLNGMAGATGHQGG